MIASWSGRKLPVAAKSTVFRRPDNNMSDLQALLLIFSSALISRVNGGQHQATEPGAGGGESPKWSRSSSNELPDLPV